MLSVYMRSGESNAAQRADQLVHQMEEQYDQGKITISPDTYHYTILANTYARSRQNNMAAKRVLEILVHMMNRVKAGYTQCEPNTRTYNAILDCLAKDGEAERAEELLHHMLNLYKRGCSDAAPDAHSFFW